MAEEVQEMPQAGTPVYISNTGSSQTQLTSVLPGVAGKTTYLTLLTITAQPQPTTVVSGPATISFDGGTTTHLTFEFTIPVTQGGVLIVPFPEPVPATAQNTGIKFKMLGIAGGSTVPTAVTMNGFQL